MPSSIDKRVEINKRIRTERRAAWFAGKCCVRCGSFDTLEYDHIDPKTKDPLLVRNSYLVWTWPEARRSAELAKCQVLCRPCHRAKSKAEGDYSHRALKGSAVGTSKLTDAGVRKIRELASTGQTYKSIAVDFGLHPSTVSDIIRGKIWSHLL